MIDKHSKLLILHLANSCGRLLNTCFNKNNLLRSGYRRRRYRAVGWGVNKSRPLVFLRNRIGLDLTRAKRKQKSSATGIPTWSPTVVLTGRYDACLPQSGRDAKFSSFYGRTHWNALCYGL
ncbi:hypothetical protein L873DRAFT_874466 [Choiromyces venosus 120613-1]|uniref:Uncharacterized protein n=1 Tax=Choiromyces venosus 120613-1 TaxID=1336337 RepID=A0A3N4JN90_9PEZI|nr:hypothetical protein L873DRAFT_874466 [Choiromyces venosus 120613-1]